MKRTNAIIPFVLLPILAACALTASSASTDSTGARLALRKPANQWMHQGTTNNVMLIVERTGFTEPVDVRFLNLPAGVTVTNTTIPADESMKDFTLVAAPDAAIVADHPVTIEVSSHGLTTSQPFSLSVKAK